jgi:hypothetical protein
MHKIYEYLDNLIKKLNIIDRGKNDIFDELKDHLKLLTNDHETKGFNRIDAEDLACKQFGYLDDVAKQLNCVTPWYMQSKPTVLLIIITMLLIYGSATMLLTYLSVKDILIEFLSFFVAMFLGYILINNVFCNYKSNIKIGAIFFVVLKTILIFIFVIISPLLLNQKFIISLATFFEIQLYYFPVDILAMYLSFISYRSTFKSVSIENPKINYYICIYLLSILTIGIYYIIPNRFYLMRILIEKLSGNIIYVERNITFMKINSIIIPNIGLIFIILITIYLLYNHLLSLSKKN